MNRRLAVRMPAAMLAVLALCSCAQPGSAPPVSEPSNSASRIRVVNDSTEELRDLYLLFPEEEVAIGDVASGAASNYVDVAHGVYTYSAFRFLRGGEPVVQRVIDFVGESPLPIDDYTYLLGVDSDRGEQLELVTVFRSRPVAAGAPDSGAVWVRVSNQGPDDLARYTMVFPDQAIYFGPFPAGATSQYTRLYTAGLHQLVTVKYTADGRTVSQAELGEVGQSTGSSAAAGVYTYLVGYDRSAPMGDQVELFDVTVDVEPEAAAGTWATGGPPPAPLRRELGAFERAPQRPEGRGIWLGLRQRSDAESARIGRLGAGARQDWQIAGLAAPTTPQRRNDYRGLLLGEIGAAVAAVVLPVNQLTQSGGATRVELSPEAREQAAAAITAVHQGSWMEFVPDLYSMSLHVFKLGWPLRLLSEAGTSLLLACLAGAGLLLLAPGAPSASVPLSTRPTRAGCA